MQHSPSAKQLHFAAQRDLYSMPLVKIHLTLVCLITTVKFKTIISIQASEYYGRDRKIL